MTRFIPDAREQYLVNIDLAHQIDVTANDDGSQHLVAHIKGQPVHVLSNTKGMIGELVPAAPGFVLLIFYPPERSEGLDANTFDIADDLERYPVIAWRINPMGVVRPILHFSTHFDIRDDCISALLCPDGRVTPLDPDVITGNWKDEAAWIEEYARRKWAARA